MRQSTWQELVCAGEMCGSPMWSSRRIPVAWAINKSSGCTEDCCALRECYCLHTSIRASLEVHAAVFSVAVSHTLLWNELLSFSFKLLSRSLLLAGSWGAVGKLCVFMCCLWLDIRESLFSHRVVGHQHRLPGGWGDHHPQRCSRTTEMWHWETPFNGQHWG